MFAVAVAARVRNPPPSPAQPVRICFGVISCVLYVHVCGYTGSLDICSAAAAAALHYHAKLPESFSYKHFTQHCVRCQVIFRSLGQLRIQVYKHFIKWKKFLSYHLKVQSCPQ